MTRSYASLPQMNMGFAGAKLAIITEGCVLTILRDDKAGIAFPGYWDLPGGARDGLENPVECALRETREELGLVLNDDLFSWGACFGSGDDRTWFFTMCAQDGISEKVVFGDEGQRWEAMPMARFLAHEKAVPHFQRRLQQSLDEILGQEKPPASWGGGR